MRQAGAPPPPPQPPLRGPQSFSVARGVAVTGWRRGRDLFLPRMMTAAPRHSYKPGPDPGQVAPMGLSIIPGHLSLAHTPGWRR